MTRKLGHLDRRAVSSPCERKRVGVPTAISGPLRPRNNLRQSSSPKLRTSLVATMPRLDRTSWFLMHRRRSHPPPQPLPSPLGVPTARPARSNNKFAYFVSRSTPSIREEAVL